MPLARQRLLAPAIRRPVVVTALLSVCFIFSFSFQSPAGSGPATKKTFPRWEKGFIFQSIIHATFLPLSPKDDEQQGNDVNIRMIQGVHSRFSVFVFSDSASACRASPLVMPGAFCLTMAKIWILNQLNK
jgi:hypothetical protein